MLCCVKYLYEVYTFTDARPRDEKRQRRIAHPLARGNQCPPRVRNRQTDRSAFQRRAEIQSGIVIPLALPAGKTWLDRRPLGGKARREATALLQADEGRQAGAQGATQHVAIFCGGDQPNYGIGKCLIGKPRFASACRVCNLRPRVRTPSSRKWRSTSMNPMRSCWPAV